MPDMDYGVWEPKIHDFDDKYHLPDDLVFGNASDEVRKIKRKYGSFTAYQQALLVIEDYMEGLIAKYGGINNFKMMASIGMVVEYIPPLPRLKRTKVNMTQERLGIIFSTTKADNQNFMIDEDVNKELDQDEDVKGNGIPFVFKDVLLEPVELNKSDKMKVFSDEETIAEDLQALHEYSKREGERLAKSGKKSKTSRSLLKEAKRRKKELEKIQRPKTVTEIIDDFVYENEFGTEEQPLCYYRGILTKREDVVAIKVANSFAAAGFDSRSEVESIDSKKLRKMVRVEADNSKKKKNKEKKKGKEEVSQDDFDSFLDDYDSSDSWGTNYKAWSKEMNMFNSEQMRRELDT